MPWDEDKKAKAIAMYKEQEPTPETSMDIVADIAEQLEESVNGVRMILTKAEVYIKKSPAASTKTSKTTGGATKLGKEEAQQQLSAAIEAAGKEVDEDIISKLTGKAAVYFTSLLA